jgi:hypothetical protein
MVVFTETVFPVLKEIPKKAFFFPAVDLFCH